MPVYFVSRIDDPSTVKIGHTDDLETRLQVIAGSFPQGIELVGLAAGGRDVEVAFHQAFHAYRVEGEWFKRTIIVESVITSLKDNIYGKRIFRRKEVHGLTGDNPIERDRIAARLLLQECMSVEKAGVSLASRQEKVFERLHQMNPLWTRRRVRGIWEGAIKRVDFYEIRDLLRVADREADAKILEGLSEDQEAA